MIDKLVSYSRIKTFLGCSYKYDLSYNKKIAPRVDDRAPTLGGAGHVGMAAGILGQNVDEALDGWAKDYIKNHSLTGVDEDIDTMITGMVDEVLQTASVIVPRALENLNLDEWETVVYNGSPLVEAKFEIPLDGWRGYVAIVDWVAKNKSTGMTWLVDHKFRKTLQADELEEYNLQMSSYQFVLKSMGIDSVGSMSNQILAKLPSYPKRNKDGTMSRAQITSTWQVYQGALLEAGLDPKDYMEMKDKLTAEFFRQSYSFRSDTEVLNTWNDVMLRSANTMANNPLGIRNLGSLSCRSCWARDYCMEELRGGDIDYLMKTEYMPKSKREEKEAIGLVEEEESE